MRTLLKLEELAMFLTGVFLFNMLPYSWWWFLILILTPDIGMLGYLISNKTGALTYNLFHHKGIALFIVFLGYYFEIDMLMLAGIILFSHASLDRVFGYGLKQKDDFKSTHLGQIGKPEKIILPEGQL